MTILSEKYKHPVPRYTSYPPANYFHSGFGVDDYRKALIASNTTGLSNISLYIHIPFCNSKCWYCGCNSSPMKEMSSIERYFGSLKTELGNIKSLLDPARKVSQVHYGGGTPNSVPAELISDLNHFIFSNVSFIEDPEIAIECHPAYLTSEYIASLKESGFNRFSLGIQDFNPAVLKSVRRDPSALPVKDIFDMIKTGEPSPGINLDFMYGLPEQTLHSFTETIEMAVQLRPDRITTFPYAHVPWVNSLQKKLEEAGLPGTNERSSMLMAAEEVLLQNGYMKIAMDHYALPGDELAAATKNNDLHRNFQGYCSRRTTGQVYAIGASGISQLDNSYAMNAKEADSYIARIDETGFATEKGYLLNLQEMIIREIISELMCNKVVLWSKIAGRFTTSPEKLKKQIDYHPEKLQMLEDDGLLRISPSEIKVTAEGEPFLRIIASTFDPMYIASEGKFSKPF
jgi:oxygen-independent coproporphyrinogen III oxidase